MSERVKFKDVVSFILGLIAICIKQKIFKSDTKEWLSSNLKLWMFVTAIFKLVIIKH